MSSNDAGSQTNDHGDPRPKAPIKVICIAGTSRSGSTIIERVLSSLPGTCTVGEASYIWQPL